jgi:hypothetical protein
MFPDRLSNKLMKDFLDVVLLLSFVVTLTALAMVFV